MVRVRRVLGMPMFFRPCFREEVTAGIPAANFFFFEILSGKGSSGVSARTRSLIRPPKSPARGGSQGFSLGKWVRAPIITHESCFIKENIRNPSSRAVSAASEEHAPIETIEPMPERAALATISQPHLPDNSKNCFERSIRDISACPIDLSTALWRPISSDKHCRPSS